MIKIICKCGRQYEKVHDCCCKVCSYYNRHKQKMDNIVINTDWSMEEMNIILNELLYTKVDTVDEILPLLNGRNLQGLCDFLHTEFHVANVHLKVKLNCTVCGKPMVKTFAHFYSDRNYCSMKCRDVFRSHYFVGEKNSSYRQVETECTNCGKKYNIIPYDLARKNSFGDNHNFCSQECYWEYRKEYYVAEKHPMFSKVYTQQERDKCREQALRNLSNGVYPQTLTKPHILIDSVMEKLNIGYENEHPFKYYCADVYLTDANLAIEVMGDYWHGSPLKYNVKNLSKLQLKDIRQDKSKHTYIKRYYNIEILYLWENDIHKHLDVCKELILHYVNGEGLLDDYNSFNYEVVDGFLKLKTDIIYPYFIEQNPVTTTIQ